MTGNKGNWLIAMKEVLRSPSSADRISFDRASSPAPSQGHRQSVDNFLSRLGPGMLDTSFNLEERSGPLEPYRRHERRSHAINYAKGSEVKKAVGDHNVQLQVQSNNNVMMKKNKLQMQSSHMNNSNKLQIQSTNSINNGNNLQMQNGSSISSNDSRPVLRQKVVLRTQQDQSRHARAVAAASAAAAEAAAVAAQAAAEIVRLTSATHQYSAGALNHLPLDHSIIIARQAERAATMIQSAYRGHLARQALRALKGLVKLQAVVRGHLVRRQARISLRCMQALVRLQAKVRARQVKNAKQESAAHMKAQQQMRAREAFLGHSYKKQQLQEIAARQRPLQLQDQSVGSPRSSILHNNSDSNHHHQLQHLKVLQETSTPRTSSLLTSDDSRDWDSSALSKEEIEFRVLKKQYAMAMRQKALAYAETHQRTPRLSGLSRRASGDYYQQQQQQQQQRYTRLSFNESEPEKLHRDWSWLEGWMAAHGAASLWESNAAALWESRDELRDRGGGEEEEEEKAALGASLFDQTSCDDDDPAIKIIEMDRPVPTPPPPRPSYHLSPSPRPQQYSLSRNSHNINYSHHHPLPQSSLHYAGSAASPRRSVPQRPSVQL